MKLIDKDRIVAEIERRVQNCAKQREEMLNAQCYTLADDASARMGELTCIKDFLDTLESKEVDFEKEIDDYINTHFSECEDGVLISDSSSMELTLLDITPLAKHFYELGLKAQKGE